MSIATTKVETGLGAAVLDEVGMPDDTELRLPLVEDSEETPVLFVDVC